MNRFKKYFILCILTGLTFSCAESKQTLYKQHIPPPLPAFQNSDPYAPETEPSNKRKTIAQYALESVGLPYRWGGHSPKTGFDCSGLIFYTHQKAHLNIPRTAKAQFDNGKIVLKENLKLADLVFFKTPKENKKFHVGIYMGNGKFIHAPGKGRQVTYGYMNNAYFSDSYIGSRSYL
jgi:cell wall-associated NlpC family hydrolase